MLRAATAGLTFPSNPKVAQRSHEGSLVESFFHLIVIANCCRFRKRPKILLNDAWLELTSGLTCFRCNPSTRRIGSCAQEAAARLTQATAGTRMLISATNLARLRRRLKRNKMNGVYILSA